MNIGAKHDYNDFCLYRFLKISNQFAIYHLAFFTRNRYSYIVFHILVANQSLVSL